MTFFQVENYAIKECKVRKSTTDKWFLDPEKDMSTKKTQEQTEL